LQGLRFSVLGFRVARFRICCFRVYESLGV